MKAITDMANPEKLHSYFIQRALDTAQRSYAEKLKVGAIAVRQGRIICDGYNGTPSGESNVCEVLAETKYVEFAQWKEMAERKDGWVPSLEDLHIWERYTSLPNVIHAEDNLIRFARDNRINLKGATLYISHAPCIDCAMKIKSAGFSEVFYANDYKKTNGINLLNNHIKISKVIL
jgi:dCMP deaminase